MISINYRDSRPIYEQIKDGLRRLILTGVIKQDEKLPSVRDLAAQTSINPNTIQRAYRELEVEGIVYSVAGKGSFASSIDSEEIVHIKELEDRLKKTSHELISLGIDKDKIKRMIDELE